MRLRRPLAFFLPLAVLLTIVVALVYGVEQQAYRSSANDPQMQIATDAVLALDSGKSPQSVAAGSPVNLVTSLAPHITVYDSQLRVVASTARLNGSVPRPPDGVLTAVSGRDRAEHRLTWQPEPGVRVAAVVEGWRGGSVLVGRSLGPAEDRIASLGQLAGLAWIAGLIALAAASTASAWLWDHHRSATEDLSPAEM